MTGGSEERFRTAEHIAELESEKGRLREELWHQWECNHSEHCDRVWPHAEGESCRWPVPKILGGP